MGDVRAIEFVSQHRVRFREVDPYGHMNMAHYLSHLVDHRFDGMRRYLDLDFQAIQDLPIAFHTRKFEIDYIRPLLAEQEFEIRSRITKYQNTALWVGFDIKNANDEQVATASMKVGCICRETGRPTRWPDNLMERFFERDDQ